MLLSIILTFAAYLSIDFAVYWMGSKEAATFPEIIMHHFKMLPIYLTANVFLTFGFIYGLGKEVSPMILLILSIVIWSVSLLIVGMVLYKVYPNWISLLGIIIIIAGALIVNFSTKH